MEVGDADDTPRATGVTTGGPGAPQRPRSRPPELLQPLGGWDRGAGRGGSARLGPAGAQRARGRAGRPARPPAR
jgi:hypothetical protein